MAWQITRATILVAAALGGWQYAAQTASDLKGLMVMATGYLLAQVVFELEPYSDEDEDDDEEESWRD